MGVFSSPTITLDEELREDGYWKPATTPLSISVAMLFLVPISIVWCGVLPVIGLLWLVGLLG